MVNSVDDWIDSRSSQSRIARLNDDIDCRAAANARVSNIESMRDEHVALGMVAIVEEDDAGVALRAQAIRDLDAQLQDALKNRLEASDSCDRSG